MENQTKSRKTRVIIFSRSILARKTEPNLKLYGETLKVYPQVKFLGITFDSKLTFKRHFEDILDHCNTRHHRLRLLANKKWEPSPSTLIQIYKQCVRPIFEYGSLSTITTTDHIISKIQWLQNKFIRLALRLPKYICSKLLHDSSGLPYVKDRFLSYASKSLDRTAQNPLVEESISSNDKLQALQNRADKSIAKVKYEDADHLQLLLKFSWLSVGSLISYEMGVFMYKTLNGLAPDSMIEMFEKQADIHQYSTRSANVGGIFIPHRNLSKGQEAISCDSGMKYP